MIDNIKDSVVNVRIVDTFMTGTTLTYPNIQIETRALFSLLPYFDFRLCNDFKAKYWSLNFSGKVQLQIKHFWRNQHAERLLAPYHQRENRLSLNSTRTSLKVWSPPPTTWSVFKHTEDWLTIHMSTKIYVLNGSNRKQNEIWKCLPFQQLNQVLCILSTHPCHPGIVESGLWRSRSYQKI